MTSPASLVTPQSQGLCPPQGSEPTPAPQPPCPLRREGALILCSAEEQALENAMLRSSPTPESEPVLGKRTRQGDDHPDEGDSDGDSEPDKEGPSTTSPQIILPSVSNTNAATVRYAIHKKLCKEQREELDKFLLDTTAGRQARSYVLLQSIENKIDTFRSAAPPYQVSNELETNISNYALAVLLSINIDAYKGNTPRNHVLDILKKYRFDLPDGIERDCASWEKITTCVSNSLTQTRSKVKKLIKASITSNTSIFALAQQIVHSTNCRTTVQLCARVALMRSIHAECSGTDKYWDLVDKCLAYIRKIAKGSEKKTNKAFNEILKKDRSTYGADEKYELEDIIADEWQQRVDDVIAGV